MNQAELKEIMIKHKAWCNREPSGARANLAGAGHMIYMASTGRSAHFFASNERALEDIRKRAAESQ